MIRVLAPVLGASHTMQVGWLAPGKRLRTCDGADEHYSGARLTTARQVRLRAVGLGVEVGWPQFEMD